MTDDLTRRLTDLAAQVKGDLTSDDHPVPVTVSTIHPRRRKYQQALADGRLLRNSRGHIVKDPTHDPGVVLCRPPLAVPVTRPIDRSTPNGGMP